MPPFYVVGPTASGKTDLAVWLAEQGGAEIVSADAYQLYAGLDLLGAKPEQAELARARHHLIGTVPLDEPMNAVRYREVAQAALADIAARGKPAIVCGGSGLYVKALTHGFDAGPPPDPARRAAWNAQPLDALVAELQRVDAAAAARIDLHNPRRVVRALEQAAAGGTERRAWQTGSEPLGICLQWEREALHRRIAARTRRMFDRGLLEEVRAARAAGVGSTAGQMIGWRECCEVLDGRLNEAQAEERITIATRQYAKRQQTWFKRESAFQPELMTGESGLRSLREAALSLMRRILPLFLGTLVTASQLAAQANPPAASAPAANPPAANAPAVPGPAALPSGTIEFERDLMEVKADPNATTVSAKFPFKVKGPGKVTLFSTETDCGCTAAALEKQIYEPGETGTITLNFNVGDRVGPQLKKIRLRASDQSEPHVLTLKTEIPVFAKILPQFVVWNHREDKTPKSVVFELGAGISPIEGLTVNSTHPGMTATVKEVEKGRKYEVVIVPTQTEQFFLATLHLTAKQGEGKPARSMQAYATVKPPPAGEPTAQAAAKPAGTN